MSISKKLQNGILRLEIGDITDAQVEAFVYYAQSNLKLGAGFGNAIAMRGGLSITKELEGIGSVEPCDAVITQAGKLKAEYIIHANGPKFQEKDTDSKLKKTMINVLSKAEKAGIKQLAFPAMGTGFYGIPLAVSAEVLIGTIKEYYHNSGVIEEIIIFANDKREYEPFAEKLQSI